MEVYTVQSCKVSWEKFAVCGGSGDAVTIFTGSPLRSTQSEEEVLLLSLHTFHT